MKYIKSQKFDLNYVKENIMGPNPIKLTEELLECNPIPAGSVVLDLGCGRGLTSIFFAREYGFQVFAADLWIAPTENKERFDDMGLTSKQIVPIYAEAHALPFADEFFDAVLSIDSYHYFGLDRNYLSEHLLPLVKHGGHILIAVPGMKKDIHHNLPEEMLAAWTAEDLDTIHDMEYWRDVLLAADGVEIVSMYEMEGYEECWNDWLACDNEYAVKDRKSMTAGAGKYMNFIGIVLKRN